MATFPTTLDIKDYLRNEKPAEDDSIYDGALASAIQTLNDQCQREFVVAPTNPDNYTARQVPVPDGYRTNQIYIGDHIAVSAIVENGTALTLGTHFQLEPGNRYNLAGVQFPYTTIRRLNTHWYYHDHHDYQGTVVVTAAWGWASIPVRVVESVKILTKDILENRDARGGLLTFADAGLASARMNPYVINTIASYRGRESWGVA